MATIHDVLAEFRDQANNNRELGDRFERLICRYLELDPLFADRFSQVWMWNEWPQKGGTGDIGIDIVAEEASSGEFCAIQCKFYLPDHNLSKGDIDSFLNALGDNRFSSGIIVSTTDKWGKNAELSLENRTKPVTRLRVQDLDNSPIDWSGFSLRRPDRLALKKHRTPLPHQEQAINEVVVGLKGSDRGKLIMACGTGKTFTSLCIAEKMAPTGNILFLVPSLSLLSQTLREWTAHSTNLIHALAVCSDTKIGRNQNKEDTDDIGTQDLAFPATTNAKALVQQYRGLEARLARQARSCPKGMTVVFSTYQSIAAVCDAQKAGIPEFDLIICDEAHRTTGVTLAGEDESHFVKIHDPAFIRGKKRLYMTATPRLFSDETKSRADEAGAELCSMDDTRLFGEELHRLGFGKAVGENLLTDYKVLVLAVDEKFVNTTFQRQIANADNELALDDAVKITGCWNGLAKKLDQDPSLAVNLQGDTAPMTKAVAFSRSIKASKAFVSQFSTLVSDYRTDHPDEEDLLHVELDHVDGSFNALQRHARLDWLKASTAPGVCRILSNARCLSEGVDVPALDAVIFLNPRNSVVDVVQSVGRVMRRAPGKEYGYIILPIGIPAGISPEEALKDNQKYKIVWQVLQALRAHDDRFNATINKIELNKKRPEQIQIIGIGGSDHSDGSTSDRDGKKSPVQETFHFPELETWKDAIYARIVKKCGERQYWENWAGDVAKIAQRHSDRIKLLLEQKNPKHTDAFDKFLSGLHQIINPAISRDEAIEMLSQHLITRPVFDALFENYSFSSHNPVSQAMQSMLDALADESLEKETASLDKFYASVRQRAANIDNAEGKQTIILELYDKFFRIAFKKTSERLGIVYTPTEVVDFIIRSVDEVLQHEFKSSLGDESVHIIDPFTGTGTFIVRLLQSGLINKEDLLRKYTKELHANEIVLLAYYIAAINIEETFHALLADNPGYLKSKQKVGRREVSATEPAYHPFEGIVLTDTFQLTESIDGQTTTDEIMFPVNNERVARQKKAPIRVVIANPPYSVGQESANDNNQNLKYTALDKRIEGTYAARSTAVNKNSLYDSYIRAIRWASDRIADRGVIGFVTNGSFIDGNVTGGLRACLRDEFTTLYIFNLRGNARTSGELRRMEKDNVFGQGSRAPIAISILVKNPTRKPPATIYYHDIGDYLTREQKLGIISKLGSLNGLHREHKWQTLTPNAEHDWINQRDPAFDRFIALNDETLSVFYGRSNGVQTNRDTWVYNFSRQALCENMERTIAFYNEEVKRHGAACRDAGKEGEKLAGKRIDTDERKIKWTRGLIKTLCRDKTTTFTEKRIGEALYRPFCKSILYYDRIFNEYYKEKLFPTIKHPNLAIDTTGVGVNKEFDVLISDKPVDVQCFANGQCFPLYLYEKATPNEGELDLGDDNAEGDIIDGYRRKSAITDEILSVFRKAYGGHVSKEDIFYYVYGVLHSPEYRRRFSADLKKMIPRIPLTRQKEDYETFMQAGRALADWHLNYETCEPHPSVKEQTSELALDPWDLYRVQRMSHPKNGGELDRTVIIYNAHLRLTGIPIEAWDYVVNGKAALGWIMERYQITLDKKSGIKNDPNEWCREHNNPRYIVDLIKKVARVAVETNRIVASLPALNEGDVRG